MKKTKHDPISAAQHQIETAISALDDAKAELDYNLEDYKEIDAGIGIIKLHSDNLNCRELMEAVAFRIERNGVQEVIAALNHF